MLYYCTIIKKLINMATNKKVIIVRGSEDGNLGVYTSKKLAFKAATEYANSPSLTYPQFCKSLTKKGFVDQGDGYGYATATTFYLNN